MTTKQVKEELREIRYYYTMKHVFDRCTKDIYPKKIMRMVEKYKLAMEEISFSKYYIIFMELYVNNTTQTDLANAWGVTRDYINSLNNELYLYLIEYFDKKGVQS